MLGASLAVKIPRPLVRSLQDLADSDLKIIIDNGTSVYRYQTRTNMQICFVSVLQKSCKNIETNIRFLETWQAQIFHIKLPFFPRYFSEATPGTVQRSIYEDKLACADAGLQIEEVEAMKAMANGEKAKEQDFDLCTVVCTGWRKVLVDTKNGPHFRR